MQKWSIDRYRYLIYIVSILYRRKNHPFANMFVGCVVLQKPRICIPLISWMKSGRSSVIWPAPVWISSLLGAPSDLNESVGIPLLRERVEELGPQNESVRCFPRGNRTELLYFICSLLRVLDSIGEQKKTRGDSVATTFYTWKPSKKSRNPWSWFWAHLPSSVRRLQLCHTFWRVCPFGSLPVETSAPWL